MPISHGKGVAMKLGKTLPRGGDSAKSAIRFQVFGDFIQLANCDAESICRILSKVEIQTSEAIISNFI